MSATAKERVRKLIKEIVGLTDEGVALLNAIGKRGTINGVKVVADIAGDQDCCTEKQDGGGGNDGPCDTPAGTIWCNPDDWTDCATGQPATVTFGGFPQAETCKECEPDETWESGFFWSTTQGGTTFSFATPNQVYSALASQVFIAATSTFYTKDRLEAVNATTYWAIYKETQPTALPEFIFVISRASCGTSTQSYCTITEPPEVCGEDWESDGTVDLAMIDGCITGSKCDPDSTAGEQGCNECQDLCGPNGETMRICATSDGGAVAYDPNGNTKGGKYDRNGNRTEQYDAGGTGGWV